MTKHECAVVMAYTGICMLQKEDLDIYYKYIEEKIGRPLLTHELASNEMEYRIKEASRKDFVKLCREAED